MFPLLASKRMTAQISVLFPEPLSPTTPKIRPFRTEMLMSLSAWTRPLGVLKSTLRP